MMLYSRFADLLDYPGPDMTRRVEACLEALDAACAPARAELERFQSELTCLTPGRLEEAYTHAFELRPETTPNLGYHLFGDDVRRSLFMAQLKRRMQAQGVEMGVELPDHWCLVLRLLARQDSPAEIDALVDDCLLPALARILAALEARPQPGPYVRALRALLDVLQASHQAVAAVVAASAGPAAVPPSP